MSENDKERQRALHEFKKRHSLSTKDLSEIVSLDASVIRRYMAGTRAVNPVVSNLLAFINASNLPINSNAVRRRFVMDNGQFDDALKGVSNASAASVFGVDQTTIYKWRKDLKVPAPAAKFMALIAFFGWPE